MLECKDLAASATDITSAILLKTSAVKAMALSKASELPDAAAQVFVHAHAAATVATARAAASAKDLTGALMLHTTSLASIATARATELAAVALRRLERTEAWWTHLEKRQRNQLVAASGLSAAVVSIGAAMYYLSRRSATRSLPAPGPSEGPEVAPAAGAEIVVEAERAETVRGREITFDPRETFEQPSLMETSFNDASSSKGSGLAPSPDVSFETETTTDVSLAGEATLLTYDASSVAGDVTLATIDLESAQSRVKELHRLAKSLARKKKYLEAAESITEALELLEAADDARAPALVPPLLGTRSLLYEQAGKIDLALRDCEAVASATRASPQRAREQKRMARLQRSLSSPSSGEGLPSPSRLSFLKNLGRRSRRSPTKAGSK